MRKTHCFSLGGEGLFGRQGKRERRKHVGAVWDLKLSAHPFRRHQKSLHLAQRGSLGESFFRAVVIPASVWFVACVGRQGI
jgi:hypothetical protein